MLLIHAARLFVVITVRYFIIAGGAYLIWWVWLADSLSHRKIQLGLPGSEIRRQEIYYSLQSSLVFAIVGALFFEAWEHGHTGLYTDISRYGWGYWFLTLPALMFAHDTYFYFTHRLMHAKWLFRRMHRAHHLSRNPTPWTAFSFHPGEALVEAVIFPLLFCCLPVHLSIFFLFMSITTILSVVNHLGYELYSTKFASNPLGRWIISATHHDQHHRAMRCNYGLYFTLWDRLLGTENPDYESTYETLRARAPRNVKRAVPAPQPTAADAGAA